jgi:tetratricopeptide (TPR) repeat protein
VSQFRVNVQNVSWSPDLTTATPPRGDNPLQDGFIRLEQAEQLRLQGKLDRAQRICESLLREHPDYMAALHTIGLIYADKENYQQSLNCLVRAAMLNPRSWSTLTALSGVYLELKAYEMAAQTLELARAIKPRDTNVLVTLGEIYSEEREYDLARDAFAQALKVEPNFMPAVAGLGWSCSYLGENVEAVAAFEAMLRDGAQSFAPLAALAQTPPSLYSIDLLSEIEKYEQGSQDAADTADELQIAFVRAAALDKAGRYKEAWEQVVPANQKIFLGLKDEVRDLFDRQRTVLALVRANRVVTANDDDKQPISLFILGPSRSGKTTMERLVGTLDGVKRGYENPGVDNAIRRTYQTAGLPTRDLFEILPPQLYPLCREIYLEELTRRAGTAQVFTNTHPARIADAAHMAIVFPNVRFIFVKRDLADTSLRMYFRQYKNRNAYAYDLKVARDHINWYHQMMDELAAKLPDRVRIINYEDMVRDPAGALRVAAELCGLPPPKGPAPAVGDDRGAAAPYREFMVAALNG